MLNGQKHYFVHSFDSYYSHTPFTQDLRSFHLALRPCVEKWLISVLLSICRLEEVRTFVQETRNIAGRKDESLAPSFAKLVSGVG